jgi:hypothetical protein
VKAFDVGQMGSQIVHKGVSCSGGIMAAPMSPENSTLATGSYTLICPSECRKCAGTTCRSNPGTAPTACPRRAPRKMLHVLEPVMRQKTHPDARHINRRVSSSSQVDRPPTMSGSWCDRNTLDLLRLHIAQHFCQHPGHHAKSPGSSSTPAPS